MKLVLALVVVFAVFATASGLRLDRALSRDSRTMCPPCSGDSASSDDSSASSDPCAQKCEGGGDKCAAHESMCGKRDKLQTRIEQLEGDLGKLKEVCNSGEMTKLETNIQALKLAHAATSDDLNNMGELQALQGMKAPIEADAAALEKQNVQLKEQQEAAMSEKLKQEAEQAQRAYEAHLRNIGQLKSEQAVLTKEEHEKMANDLKTKMAEAEENFNQAKAAYDEHMTKTPAGEQQQQQQQGAKSEEVSKAEQQMEGANQIVDQAK